jgi:hypothetical protein
MVLLQILYCSSFNPGWQEACVELLVCQCIIAGRTFQPTGALLLLLLLPPGVAW